MLNCLAEKYVHKYDMLNEHQNDVDVSIRALSKAIFDNARDPILHSLRSIQLSSQKNKNVSKPIKNFDEKPWEVVLKMTFDHRYAYKLRLNEVLIVNDNV